MIAFRIILVKCSDRGGVPCLILYMEELTNTIPKISDKC